MQLKELFKTFDSIILASEVTNNSSSDNQTRTLETERLTLARVFTHPQREMWDIIDKGLDTPEWLRGSIYPKKIGEMTIDFTPEGVYLNRIDVSTGKGFGTETMKAILDDLNKRGHTAFKTYIENSNHASQNMVRKLGFKESETSKEGSYWVNE